MIDPIHPVALFRLSVLGPLINREFLNHGELKETIRQLAQQPYDIPGSRRCYLSEKTIEAWYYAEFGFMRSTAVECRHLSDDNRLSLRIKR